ncbi:MAG: MFS transporter [Actinomycetia bacterium]|nr:MFS transporter [Actinomycetes bacterium]
MSDSALGRRFWVLWAAFSAANLGDGISYVAFPLLAFELVDDARMLGVVAAFRFLPIVLVGLPAGVIIDRFDRRRLAALAQIARSGVLGALALAVATGRVSIVFIIVSAFLVGLGEVVTDGGLPALVRELVRTDQLEVANSRISATQTVTNLIIGPPVGAAMFGLGASLPFVTGAVTFAVGAVALQALPGQYRAPQSERREGPLRELTVGLRYVWGHPVLRPLAFTVAAFAFASEAGNTVFVVLATERLGLEPVGFGLLISLDAVVSVVMSFFGARLVGRIGHAGSLRFSVAAFALSALIMGSATIVAVAAVAMALSGVSEPTWNVVSSTLRQRLVPDEVFGRMMTAYLVVAWSLQPLGALAGGMVAEVWGPEWVYLASGLLVGSLLVGARPLFTQVERAMAEVN